MEQYIVKIRVSKKGTPDVFMSANRNATATSISAVITRLTTELDKMIPIEEKADA